MIRTTDDDDAASHYKNTQTEILKNKKILS